MILILFITVIVLTGCIEVEESTSAPTPITVAPKVTSTPSIMPTSAPTILITPTPTTNADRELIKKYLQMHGFGGLNDEQLYESVDQYIELYKFQNWDIHPSKIYQGRMIFYQESYGYIYIPHSQIDENEFKNLVKRYGGTTSYVLSPSQLSACFSSLSIMENFLIDFSAPADFTISNFYILGYGPGSGTLKSTYTVSAYVTQINEDTIILTYCGGPDENLVKSIQYEVNGISGSSTGRPMKGEQYTITGAATSGRDHVVMTATFDDGTTQVILDSYI